MLKQALVSPLEDIDNLFTLFSEFIDGLSKEELQNILDFEAYTQSISDEEGKNLLK